MSENEGIYLIDSVYNSIRDAYEVTFGYIEKDMEVDTRNMNITVTVNIKGNKVDKKKVIKKAEKKARDDKWL